MKQPLPHHDHDPLHLCTLNVLPSDSWPGLLGYNGHQDIWFHSPCGGEQSSCGKLARHEVGKQVGQGFYDG